jgi:hypothetical protein
MRSLRYGVADTKSSLRCRVHLGCLVELERMLAVRRQGLPLLRSGQMGVVLRQRLRLDQRLRELLRFQLPRVLKRVRRR